VSFRELKARIYWPTTDQKVRGSNPCGRTRLSIHKNWEIKLLKKFLFLAGFSLTRITNNSLKPVELNEDENKIIDYVRANNLSMCTTLNLQQTAIACKYIVMNKIPGDFVECGVYKGGNALIAAKIFDLYKSEKKVYLFDTFSGMSEPSKYDVLTDGKLPMLDRYLSVKRELY
jgi:hypothetical protein